MKRRTFQHPKGTSWHFRVSSGLLVVRCQVIEYCGQVGQSWTIRNLHTEEAGGGRTRREAFADLRASRVFGR